MITAKLLWVVGCDECMIPISTHSGPQFNLYQVLGSGWTPQSRLFINYKGSHLCETCQAKAKTEQTK